MDACDGCRGISLHIGSTTVRMSPEMAEALWVMLGEGLSQLVPADGSDAASSPRGLA